MSGPDSGPPGGRPRAPSDPEPDGDPPPPSREPLTLVHHHPGRLRVRADAFRESERRHDGGDEEGGAEAVGQAGGHPQAPASPPEPSPVDRVRAALDAEPGIAAFHHNPRTGSLLVEYQPGLTDSETLLSLIADAADLAMPSDESLPAKKPAIIAIDAAREVNELVADITGHQTDLRGLVPMGMAALAAYSFVYHKDARLPRWDNLLYWSYNIFTQLHRREIDGKAGGRPGAPAEGGSRPRTEP